MTNALLLRPPSTTPETDPQTLTDWKVLVFDTAAGPGGAQHLAIVQAHTKSEATLLATTEAEATYPEVKAWDVWFIARFRLEDEVAPEDENILENEVVSV